MTILKKELFDSLAGLEGWVECLWPQKRCWPQLFLWSRLNKPQVASTCFSFPLWLLLTFHWPNKGNQIYFSLCVSLCSMQFRVHLRGSLFQDTKFQCHCVWAHALAPLQWAWVMSKQSLITLPGILPKQKMSSPQLQQSITSTEHRVHQVLCA